MLSPKDVIDILNKKTTVNLPFLDRWRNVYYDMSLHTTGACPRFRDPRNNAWVYPTNYYGEQYQLRFELFLLNRHPRENEATRQWRLANYRPLTKAPFKQVMDVTIGAIFQDSNYTVEIDKKDSDYIWGNNFEGKNLIQYYASKFQSICEDPNGFFCYIPKYVWHQTKSEVEPECWFINTKDIVHVSPDEVVFYRTNLAWHINLYGIFRYQKNEKTGSYENVDGANGYYYPHLLEYLPIDIAGGEPNTQGYLESWLDKAKPIADDFIGGKSASQLVDKEASHPWIIAVSSDCPDCDQSTGWKTGRCLNWTNDDPTHVCEACDNGWIKYKCSSCGGSGQVSRNPGDWLNVPADLMEKGKMLDIVSPDIGINTYHRDNNGLIYKMLMEALFLYRSDKAESAVSKAIDQENKYQFISKISNDYFDRLIPNGIKIVTSYRNIGVSNGIAKPNPANFTIVKPTQFQIETAEALMDELSNGIKANLPAFDLVELNNSYIDKKWGGNEVMKKKGQFISQDDPLSMYSISDKKALVGVATDNKGVQYSINLPVMLDQVIREKGQAWFVKAKHDDIKAEISIIFDKIPKIAPPEPKNNTPTGL